MEDASAVPARPAEYRYGAVLALTVALAVLLISAPASDWTRAATLGIQLGMLIVIVATSRARAGTRRARALLVAAAGTALVIATGTGAIPVAVVLVLSGLLAAVLPLAVVGGLTRLIRDRGVTGGAVAGALAIYLLVGLLFAAVIAVIAHVGAAAYFANGTDGSTAERVYFSFTTLTTTGYGDFTPAQSLGRALAVVEMLVGQLYLVTVIGVLVGHLAARART